MCRLSIIVPYDRDEAAFETTLVSVLENRPEHCEILVAHDGGYNDPFDLGDEVRFVVAGEGGAVGLIRAGVQAAMGRIVHVLGSGARATDSWTEEPCSMFEQSDLGMVSPVIRDVADPARILAAGWTDSGRSLRKPVGRGGNSLQTSDLRKTQGVFLFASFWRRSLLEGLLDLPTPLSLCETDYLWSAAARKIGWRCRVGVESQVLGSQRLLSLAGSATACGKFMQQVRFATSGDSASGTVASCLISMALAPFGGGSLSEAFGRLQAVVGGSASGRKLAVKIRQLGDFHGPDASQPRVLSMPATTTRTNAVRRAA